MAQVSKGSFTTNASEGRSLTFNWAVDSTSISGNYKKIYWSLVGSGSAGGYVLGGDFKVVIDGETVYNSSTRIELWNGTVVASGYKILYHNTYGNKSFSASVQASIYEFAVDNKGSGTWELPTIPRYATSNQSLNSKTETTIKMNWSSDNTVDYIWYSKDNGSTWSGLDVTDGTSGNYTISGLSANTTYNIKTRVRRKDSQLTTDSSPLSVATYAYPYCSSAPNFTIGNALTIGLYNPLGRNCTVEMVGADGSTIYSGNGWTGTSVQDFKTTSIINNLYASIPNAQSGTYKVKVTYGSNTSTKTGGTYKIKGTETPAIGALSYGDIDTTVTSITGNSQHIVQNKSRLRVFFDPATPQNYATIKEYKFELNGSTLHSSSADVGYVTFGYVDSSRDVTLTLTVTDSRGLTAKKTMSIKMLSYELPNATVDLARLNNYEDETYLTVDGSVASVDSKNTMTIKYRYKVSGGSYGSFVTIGDRAKQTLSLDKNNVYVFNVVVTDAFGSQHNAEYTLGKGVFPLFIDTVKNSVGINCFPAETNSLEVNGFNLFNVYKCCKNILLGSSGGLKITVNNFANSDKIPIIVVGADNASMTPVFTVIHLRSGSGFGHLNLGLESTVTRDGNSLHITASQWSYFTVFAPLGADITLSNSAL